MPWFRKQFIIRKSLELRTMAVLHKEWHFQCIYFEYIPHSFLYPFLIFLSEEQKWCWDTGITTARRKVPANEDFTSAEMRVRNTNPKNTYNVLPHYLHKREIGDSHMKTACFCFGENPKIISWSVLFALRTLLDQET